jgi:hypothetical protein
VPSGASPHPAEKEEAATFNAQAKAGDLLAVERCGPSKPLIISGIHFSPI